MKFFLLISTFCIAQVVFGQSQPVSYNHLISAKSDNDSYLLSKRDMYYTSGMQLQLDFLDTETQAYKKVNSIVWNHKIYNSFYGGNSADLEAEDRPYAAYHSLGFKQKKIREDQYFSWGANLGLIGKSALGKQSQTNVHEVLGLYEVSSEGWSNQIDLGFPLVFHVNGEYFKNVSVSEDFKNRLSLFATSNLGTAMNHIEAGLEIQLGFVQLQKMNHSARHGAGVGILESPKELFLFFRPSGSWILSDATIEGALLGRDLSAKTYSREPFVFDCQLGVFHRTGRLNLEFGVNYQTKTTTVQKQNHLYGNINVGYFFN